jgi:hypothetical protein
MNKLLKRKTTKVRLGDGAVAFVHHHGLPSLFDALRDAGYDRVDIRKMSLMDIESEPSAWEMPYIRVERPAGEEAFFKAFNERWEQDQQTNRENL